MATKKASLEINAKLDGALKDLQKLQKEMAKTQAGVAKVDERMAKAEAQVESFGDKAGKAMKLAAGAVTLGAIKKVTEATLEWADESRKVQGVFDNLAYSIEPARRATQGLVSDMDLATAAAKANSLGVADNADQFALMVEVAAKASRAMGTDMGKSVDDLTTALGRQSPMILDNLGVTLTATEANEKYAKQIGKSASELTDAEKKTAFTSIALQKLSEKYSSVDVSSGSAAEAIKKLTVEVENQKTELQGGEAKAANLASAMQKLGDRTKALQHDFLQHGDAQKEVSAALAEYGETIDSVGGKKVVFNAIIQTSANLYRDEARAAEESARAQYEAAKIAREAGANEAFELKRDQIKMMELEGVEKAKIHEANRRLMQQEITWLGSQKELNRTQQDRLDWLEREIRFEAKREDIARKKKGGGGSGRSNEEAEAQRQKELQEMIATAITRTTALQEQEKAAFDAKVAAYNEFNDWQAQAEAEKAALAQQRFEDEAKRQEELIRLEAEKQKALDESTRKYGETAREYSGALGQIVVASAQATGSMRENFRKELEEYTKAQALKLAIQSAAHFGSAIAYAASLNPVKAAAEATAGGIAAAKAAGLGIIAGVSAGVGGAGVGGSGGGTGTPGGAGFAPGGPGMNRPTGGSQGTSAPVSPFDDGRPMPQAQQAMGQSINVTVNGSVLSQGDLQRAIRDAIRSGVQA